MMILQSGILQVIWSHPTLFRYGTQNIKFGIAKIKIYKMNNTENNKEEI